MAKITVNTKPGEADPLTGKTLQNGGQTAMSADSYNNWTKNQIATPAAMAAGPQPNTLQASPADSGGKSTMGSPTDSRSANQIATPAAMAAGPQQTAPQTPQQPQGVPDGWLAIRKTLNDRGIDDKRIRWNEKTGMVTVDGRDIFKPDVNIDGTTYANEKTMNTITHAAYHNAGDDLQAARNYVSSQLDSSLVTWDGASGMVNIAGTPIKPAYVSADGVAYVPKSQLDRAIAAYRTQNGTITPQDTYKDNNNKFDDLRDSTLNALLNRKEFKYDPDNDPVYAAYKKMYEREANEAMRRVLNDNNASLTTASGAVLSQAIAARDAQLAKITDMIPELASDAYARYTGETGRLRNNFNDVYQAAADDLKRRTDLSDTIYDRGQDAIKNYNEYAQNQFYENRTTDRDRRADLTQDIADEGMRLANQGTGYDNVSKRETARIAPAMATEELRGAGLANESQEINVKALRRELERSLAYDTNGVINANNQPYLAQIFKNNGYAVNNLGIVVDASGKPIDSRKSEYDYIMAAAKLQAYGSVAGTNQANSEYGILGL